jgi:preprotein translocase subunit SecG
MITLLILLLIIDSILLIAVVLMQSSKGNGLAGPIGGSSVTMAFGVRRTSDLLTRSSTVLAAILIVGCIVVNLMIGNKGTVDESIIQKNAGQQEQQMPPTNNAPPSENNPPPSNEQGQTNENGNKPQEQNKPVETLPDKKKIDVSPEGPETK